MKTHTDHVHELSPPNPTSTLLPPAQYNHPASSLTCDALHLAQHAVSCVLVGQHKGHGADALRIKAQVLPNESGSGTALGVMQIGLQRTMHKGPGSAGRQGSRTLFGGTQIGLKCMMCSRPACSGWNGAVLNLVNQAHANFVVTAQCYPCCKAQRSSPPCCTTVPPQTQCRGRRSSGAQTRPPPGCRWQSPGTRRRRTARRGARKGQISGVGKLKHWRRSAAHMHLQFAKLGTVHSINLALNWSTEVEHNGTSAHRQVVLLHNHVGNLLPLLVRGVHARGVVRAACGAAKQPRVNACKRRSLDGHSLAAAWQGSNNSLATPLRRATGEKEGYLLPATTPLRAAGTHRAAGRRSPRARPPGQQSCRQSRGQWSRHQSSCGRGRDAEGIRKCSEHANRSRHATSLLMEAWAWLPCDCCRSLDYGQFGPLACFLSSSRSSPLHPS